MTEDTDSSSVPPPGDAITTTGAGVAPPPSSDSGAAITIVGALVPPPTAGARDVVPVPGAGEGWFVVVGAVGAAVLGPAVVASTGEAEGFGTSPPSLLSTGVGATVAGVTVPAAAVVGEGDGLPVDSSTGGVEGGKVGLCVAEAAETGAGVVTNGAPAAAAVPPVEIGSDTASAYDWGPPSTSLLAADTRTAQVPAVTSDAGTTMRSTLLLLSREHDESPPLHFPDLRCSLCACVHGCTQAGGRGGGGGDK